ncbi:transcriptional repressor [Microcella sp.]|uniref:Fur family transcriptional regulator n=1 Tax=Microcella sp. TaxID=1913979 RepID=UPI0033160FE3
MTTARRVVIEALATQGGHPTAEDLSATIAQHHPGIHRATVYRTLETLTEMGVVAHVHLGHGAAAYHLLGSPQDVAHLHALCHQCGRVFDLPGSLMDEVAERVREEIGFELEASHHALSGLCRACTSTTVP